MYLLDTCVFSEFSKREPIPNLLKWASTIPEADIYLSTLVLGELLRCVVRLKDSLRKQELQQWVEGLFTTHQSRLVLFDPAAARVWTQIVSRAEAAGKSPSTMDSLIAASALANGLTLVTRKTDDFQGLGVSLLNPWK